MVTTREAAPSVRLNADWQSKYRSRARQLLASPSQSAFKDTVSVCIVGRSGVGKASFINHLIREYALPVVHSGSASTVSMEREIQFQGFHFREIPSYDGRHMVRRRRHFHRSSNGSNSGSSNGGSSSSNSNLLHNNGREVELEEFVQLYHLFEEETKAVIFVVNNRITAEDQKLVRWAIDHRKFFCIVRTHTDSLLSIRDTALLNEHLETVEEQVRQDLGVTDVLNVRVFVVCIPWPLTDTKLEGLGFDEIQKNVQNLQFPLLEAYLSEPRGLLDELQIFDFVKEEVWKALEPFHTVKKRHQLLDFSQHLVAGTLVPIAGPVMVSFSKTLYCTLKACKDVGLIEDADDAMQKINAEANKAALGTRVASKEGLLTAVHDSLVHIFGTLIFEIAIAEVVSTAADVATGALPLVGPVISAAHLPSRFRKIAEKLSMKACMLHQLWIMQNITGLLTET